MHLRTIWKIIKPIAGFAFSFYLWYLVQVNDECRSIKGLIAFILLCIFILVSSYPDFRYKHNVQKTWLRSLENILRKDVISEEYKARVSIYRLRSGIYACLRFYFYIFPIAIFRGKETRKQCWKSRPNLKDEYLCLWDRVISQREKVSLTMFRATYNGESYNGVVDWCFRNKTSKIISVAKLDKDTLPLKFPSRREKIYSAVDNYMNSTHLDTSSYPLMKNMTQLSCKFVVVPLKDESANVWGVLLLESADDQIPDSVLESALEQVTLSANLFKAMLKSLNYEN